MSKRSPSTGRFVAYLCERCEDEGTVMCRDCAGSGIGRWGDPDTSVCLTCHGSSSVPCSCRGEDDDEDCDDERDRRADREYEMWKRRREDRAMERARA